jgi:hypothetical protein
MTQLYLYDNDFDAGSVPSWVSSFTQLQVLYLGKTNRNGNMASIDLAKSVTTMMQLHLNGNDFDAGSVPSWVSSFTQLQVLHLGNTNRNGNMASIDLAKSATTMTHLYLDGNDFDAGPAPLWLSSFTRLQVLRLGDTLNSDLSLVVRILSELATAESARVAMATTVDECQKVAATAKQCEGLEVDSEVAKAKTELDVANSKLDVANSKLDLANSKLDLANSELDLANAELEVINRNLSSYISREQQSEPPKRCSSVAIAVLAALTFLLTVGVIILVVRIRALVDQVTAAHQHVLQQDRHATLPMTNNPLIQRPPPPEYLLPRIGQEAIYTQTKLDQAVSDCNEDPSTAYAELDAGHVEYGSSA